MMTKLVRLSRMELERKEPEWFDGVLERISNGVGPYVIAKEEGLLYGSLMEWFRADEGRNSAFLNAQMVGAQKMVDESLELADGMVEGEEFKTKLRIDTRLRIAGKLDPRFGNGPSVAVSGTNVQVVMTDFREKLEEE